METRGMLSCLCTPLGRVDYRIVAEDFPNNPHGAEMNSRIPAVRDVRESLATARLWNLTEACIRLYSIEQYRIRLSCMQPSC